MHPVGAVRLSTDMFEGTQHEAPKYVQHTSQSLSSRRFQRDREETWVIGLSSCNHFSPLNPFSRHSLWSTTPKVPHRKLNALNWLGSMAPN